MRLALTAFKTTKALLQGKRSGVQFVSSAAVDDKQYNEEPMSYWRWGSKETELDGVGKSDLPADYPETCFPALLRPELWWIDGCVFRLHSPHVTCRFDSRSIIWQQWNVKKLQGWENKEGLLQAATCSGLDLNSHWMYSPVHLTCCRQKVKLYLTFLELEV